MYFLVKRIVNAICIEAVHIQESLWKLLKLLLLLTKEHL
jgi:hypothetical protein